MVFFKKTLTRVLLLILFTSSSIFATTQTGLEWLNTQISPDNNYTTTTKVATSLQSLSEMLNAMYLTEEGIPLELIDQMNADDYNSTEHLSRKISGNLQAKQDISSFLIKLLKHQSMFGGFGELEGYNSTVVDTAFALESLSSSSVDGENSQYAISYLLDAQAEDGSWKDGKNVPSVYVTSLAMHAIWSYRARYNVTAQVEKARNFLLAKRQSDGSWGETYLTALALSVLIPTLEDKTSINNSITYLEGLQTADGSWEGDIYVTALALQALLIDSKPIANPDLGLVRGRVIDSVSNSPLAGIDIILKKDTEVLSRISEVDGSFEFYNLAAGKYKFVLAKDGYLDVTGHITLQEGQNVDLGDVKITYFVAPTTGAIQGIIKDKVTGNALSGATVSAGTLTVQTDDKGNYQIDNIQPGSLTIRVGKDGYVGVVANGKVTAGTTSIFSPSLTSASSAVTAILGKVVDSVSGAPIKATIILSGANTQEIQTNDDGTYLIENLSAGNTTVTASLDAYQSTSFELAIALNNTYDVSPSLLPLSELSSVLDVSVMDGSTNNVLSGVSIKLSGSNTRIATTGSNGKYKFENLDSGEISILAERSGYAPINGSLILRDNVIQPLSISLFPVAASKAIIQGTVVNAVTGEVIPTATVTLSGVNDGSKTSNAQGGYAFSELFEGETGITIEADGFTSKTIQTVVTADETLVFVDQLYPIDFQPAKVTFQVIDAVTDSIFEGIAVNVRHSGFNSIYTTDKEGRVEIGDIIGRKVEVSISLSGFTTKTLEINVNPSDVYDAGVVKLFRNGITELEADLFIHSIDRSAVITDPFTLSMHGNLLVNIANQGTSQASTFEVLAYFDIDNNGVFDLATDEKLGSSSLDQILNVGDNENVTISINSSTLFADRPVSVWVDSGENVLESNEENNNASTGCLNCGENELGFTYTFDNDFDKGSSINVAHLAEGQLQLDEKVQTFDVMWVAASAHGTIVKINTKTGEVLGEYRSGPQGRNLNPSRTTVDNNGNVWAGNRNDDVGGRGSVVKIGLVENGQCEDRNGNGIIDTSTGLGDIKGWGSSDYNGGVSQAADECIINYVRVSGTGVRHVTVDKNNNVWVGGYGNRRFDVLDGETGKSLTNFLAPCGGYGGLIDANGVLWSARYGALLRYDTHGTPTDFNDDTMSCLNISYSYGMGIDGFGNIWNSNSYGNSVTKISPSGQVLGRYSTQGSVATGLVVGHDNDAWVTNRGSNTVARIANDGTFKALVSVGGNPTGGAVDSDGKIWMSSRTLNQFTRIDPATNQVDMVVKLRPGAQPYNYSDMTGSLLTGKPDEGTWTVTKDSGVNTTKWGKVSWTDYLPEDANISVYISVSEDGISYSTPKLITKGEDSNLTGRYLNMSVRFVRASNDESPILYDISVKAKNVDYSVSALKLIDNSNGTSLSLSARVANSGLLDSSTEVKASFYDGDPLKGGTLIGTESIASLKTGEYWDVKIDGITTLSGADIYVIVDPENISAECDEENNILHIPYSPDVTVGNITASTDLSVYIPNMDVKLQATVRNPGNFAYDFDVKLQIVDANGALVIALPVQAINALGAGDSKVVTDIWNTGLTISSNYKLEAILLDKTGTKIDEASADFGISSTTSGGSNVTAALRTTTNKPVYHTTDTLVINNLVQNLSINSIIEAAIVRIDLFDPNGTKIYTHDLNQGDLVSGAIRNAPLSLPFIDAVEGMYAISANLLDQTGKSLAMSSTTCKVEENARLALLGNMSVEKKSLYRGETQVCKASVYNNGSNTYSKLQTRGLTVFSTTEEIVFTQNDVFSIAKDETSNSTYTISTENMQEGEYLCILQAEINGTWETLAHDTYTLVRPPIEIDSLMQTGSHGPLLVLLDSPVEYGWCLGIFATGFHGHDPYGPKDAPLLVEQRAYLENLLDTHGYNYTIVDSEADFKRELRSGNYSTYALFNEYINMSSQTLSEIREAVYRGDGLLFAGKHQYCNDELEKPLGLDFRNTHDHVTNMTMIDTAEYSPSDISLAFEDKATRFRLKGAEALGSFEIKSSFFNFCPDDEKYSLTRNKYKHGRGVFAAFDLLMQAATPGAPAEIERILLEALDDIQPDVYNANIGSVYPIHMNMVNKQIATQGYTETRITGASVLDAGKGVFDANTSLLNWRFTLSEGGTDSLDYWIKIPNGSAHVDIETSIYAGETGLENFYESITHTIAVDTSTYFSLQDALDASNAVGSWSLNTTEYHIKKAIYDEGQGDYSRALSHAIDAADCLAGMTSPEADAIRGKLAQAIRALSAKI